jgi:hypothetical protein
LLKRLEDGRFEHAVFLTYSLDLLYFETAVVRHLVRRGCGNVIVFADGRHVAEELTKVADPRWVGGRSTWGVGRTYSLTPVFHTSAFHPKVALIIGEEVELVVGSGNLEAGGLRSNLEIFHEIQCDRDGQDAETRHLLSGVWEYVTQRVAKRVPSFVEEQLSRVQAGVGWLGTPEEHRGDVTTRLIVGPGTDAVEALREAVGRDKVRSLIVVGPFFDADLGALRRLIARLGPQVTQLIIQPDTVSLPGKHLRGMRNVEVYRLDEPVSRYLHAKIVVAECATRSVLLAGSHNISELAMKGAQFEAGLLRVSRGQRFSSELALTRYLRRECRVDLNVTDLRLRAERIAGEEPRNDWLVSAQVDAGVVEVVTLKRCSEGSRLLAFVRDREMMPHARLVSNDGSVLRFHLRDAAGSEQWTAVAVEDRGARSAPAPVLIVEALHRIAVSGAGSLPKRMRAGSVLELDDVAELLQEFGDWLMREPRAWRRPQPERAPKVKEAPATGQKLSYEDFVIPWKPGLPVERRVAGRSGVETVVAAIVRAVGGSRGQLAEPEIIAPPVDDEDASLADRSLYGEEALSGSRLEQDPERVREMEFDTREEDPRAATDTVRAEERDGHAERRREVPVASGATRLRAARRVERRLDTLVEAFPEYVEERCGQGQVGVELLETISTTGRLLTAMAGRTVRASGESTELLTWERWAEFQVAVLRVVTAEETGFLRRLPWSTMRLELHRQMVEEFAGYLAGVLTVARMSAVPGALSAHIKIGVFRAHRILGAHVGKLRANVVEAMAENVLAALTPGIEPPAVAWSNWVEVIRHVGTQDVRLRRRFGSPDEIHGANAGLKDPGVGDWVWWPHTGQHVATIVEVKDGLVILAAEPGVPKSVMASYVVGVPQGK